MSTEHHSGASAVQDQSSRQPNRLIHETSPYLLQHAYNPVDWFPWGEEAFRVAREQDKPIFLSIGYSACHWCHVMEHESFENPQIAKLMNECFVNIKVDREERPDLDQIYMAAVQLITKRGGWPMSVFLDHSASPFYGGTYWPPISKYGMPSFVDILRRVHEYWVHKREDCLQSSQEIVEAISQTNQESPERVPLNQDQFRKAGQKMLRSVDRRDGGFGQAPKFPHAMELRGLLRYAVQFNDSEALSSSILTLDKMAQGGIYDHLEGAFARYSTDEKWLVPHFEKMLYDNALLVPAYLEGWQVTKDQFYRQVVTETLDFVLAQMTSPQGGFYSTFDADSEGVEGKYYVWTEAEIIQHIGSDDARIFNFVYDVTTAGNWEGHTILNLPRRVEEAARIMGVSVQNAQAVIARSKAKLIAIRKTRIPPGRDEKILTSWNGMMITAMAMAGRILNEDRYIQAARDAVQFIAQHLIEADGRLLHAYKDGRARFNGYLDDYACLIDGLLELFSATADPTILNQAMTLTQRMCAQFSDQHGGTMFYTSSDHETLVLRNKDTQDNATPSGNTMAATALIKLSALIGKHEWYDFAMEILNSLSYEMTNYPLAYGQALLAMDLVQQPLYEIVLVKGSSEEEWHQLQQQANQIFLPHALVMWNTQTPASNANDTSISVLAGKLSVKEQATAYICQLQTCQAPVVGIDAILSALRKLANPDE
jgi:hypothetical protein